MRSTTATFLAWVLIVSAQQAPQQAQTPAPGTKKMFQFEASSNLVIETVSLKDKSGNPVEGLKATDFVVMEDGKPQTVKFFEFQKLENEAAPAPEPGRRW